MTDSKPKLNQVSRQDVPKAVINRLSLYLRELQHLLREGSMTTSSSKLGLRLGFTDAQVRKDLAYFGQFGHPGVGYRCEELVTEIRRILGTDQQWNVALIGVGNLGQALLGYRRFEAQGFKIVACFDLVPQNLAAKVENIPLYPMDQLEKIILEKKVQLGMLTVPAKSAQEVADRLVQAGVQGIVNFAPVTLSLPTGVSQVGVDLATELELLAFTVANQAESR